MPLIFKSVKQIERTNNSHTSFEIGFGPMQGERDLCERSKSMYVKSQDIYAI